MATAATVRTGGEEAVYRTTLHPMSTAGAWMLAAFLLFVGSLIVRHNELSLETNLRVIGGSLLLAGAALAGPLRRLRRTEFVVTPAVLRMRLGTWRFRVLELPLRDVRRVDVVATRLGKRLGFGAVHVASADGTVVTVPHVRHADRLGEAMRRAARR